MTNAVITVKYQKGSYIVVEGEKSDGSFYIIQEGEVILNRTISISDLSRETLKAGDFFEVESGLTGNKRLSTAIARTDAVIICVNKDMFDVLIQKRPSLVEKFIRSFSNKMRDLDYVLTKISLQTLNTHLSPERVFEVASYYEQKGKIQYACFIYYNIAQQNPETPIAKESMEQYERLFMRLSEVQQQTVKEPNSGTVKVPKDCMIVGEGLHGNTMFFIQEGSVKICKIANNSELVLAVLNKGNLFGEMALLESKPRSASAVTMKDSELLVINHQTFPLLVQRKPKIITRITTVLADRIWFIYRQIVNASMRTEEEKIYDGLLMFMEKNWSEEKFAKTFSLDFSMVEFLTRIGLNERKSVGIINDLKNKQIIAIEEGKLVVLNPRLVSSRAQLFRSVQHKESKS